MQIYNDPNGSPSSIGTQFNTSYWDRRSLIDAAEKMFFSPLADVRSMPKHYGKELKVYYYIPLLDERNLNDQGLDAAGVTLAQTQFFVTFPRLVMEIADADKAALVTAINANTGDTVVATAGADGSGPTANFATITLVGGLQAIYNTAALADTVTAFDIGAVQLKAGGNIYGSSKDVGTISGRMPTLTETGGRVNRVGFTRIERTGTLAEHGFFMEFTEDSLTFDTDSELYGHMSRELVAGANEVTEDLLQVDILTAATTIVFAGTATADSEISGEAGASQAVVDYADLKRLSIALDDNRTPKNTKIISGSRMVDTKTVNASRLMYIGSDLQTTMENMVDGLGNAAFKPVREYSNAGTILNGEIGAVGDFRIIIVPNMMNFVGAGAVEGTNPGFKATGGHYDVFPMLVVGGEAFATVGLQSSGAKGGKQKFKIIVKKPGKEMATVADPYGKIGFSSITFYHGFIALRPERLGLVKAVAPT